jgi:hypothetical protein
MPAITPDPNFNFKFKSEYIIYEQEVRCKVGENEFNFSNNPTITTDNSGSITSFATGSDFSPYVTTVGLYNENSELLAVAKLSQAISLSSVTDTTFVVKYDL